MQNTTPSRDLELLSAHLDGQLTPGDTEALLARLEQEPELTAAFKQLQRTRSLLRRAPQRRLPRSFMLTPQMAGQRQRSRLGAWSGLNFASALATLALILVLVTDVSVNGLPSFARTPEPVLMMAEAPVEESYASDSAQATGAAESQLADETAGGAEEPSSLMLESTPADESLRKEAIAPTPSQWVVQNASTLETLLASLAIIAGLLAWHLRRR